MSSDPASPDQPHSGERRATPRSPITDIYVEIRTDEDSEDPRWAASAVDVNEGGMALVLPREVYPGDRLYLRFRIGRGPTLEGIRATVVRQDGVGVGAVRFELLSEAARQAIRDFIASRGSTPPTGS